MRLVRLELAECLGGRQDSSPIAVDVRKALGVEPAESDRFRSAVATALGLIGDHAATLDGGLATDVRRELGEQLALARSLLGTGQSPALPTAWELDQGRVFVLSFDLQESLSVACASPAAPCPAQFELVKEVLRIVHLARTALDVSETPLMRAHLEESARRAQMWDEYFTGTRSQYIWELAVNGWRMDDTREAVNGVKRGFRAVPSSQVMLLHPSVAFEYADAEPEGNRFAGVVLVDLLGYNRWTWRSDGSMGFAVGASVILAVGDHAKLDDVGWGLMLHLEHRWSIGVTFGGDSPSILVSGDIAQLWTRVSSIRKRRMMTGQ